MKSLAQTLSKTWTIKDTKQQSKTSYASQMTLVLFSGPDLDDASATRLLDTLAAFSKNYPCRVLWMLLEEKIEDTWSVRAKLQAYSHLSTNTGGTCCEIIMLECSVKLDRQFLTGLLSTCIHTDLPVYFWIQQMRAEHLHCIPQDIKPLRCTVIDSSKELQLLELLKKTLPPTSIFKDLAYARSLPTRQAIGQFLSSYAPATLIKDLEGVTIEFEESKSGEAHHTLEWARHCIETCAEQAGHSVKTVFFKKISLSEKDANCALKLNFSYSSDKSFQWSCCEAQGLATIEAKLDSTARSYALPLRPVAPAWALADALFF